MLDELSDDTWHTTQEVHAALGDPKPSQEGVRISLTGLAERDQVLRDPPIDQWAGPRQGASLEITSVVQFQLGTPLGTELLRGAP